MRPLILYPFELSSNNLLTYSAAMELARLHKAELVLLAASSQPVTTTIIEEVHHHLLELNGQYRTLFKRWSHKHRPRPKVAVIEGTMQTILPHWLAGHPASFVITQPHSSDLNEQALMRWISPSSSTQWWDIPVLHL